MEYSENRKDYLDQAAGHIVEILMSLEESRVFNCFNGKSLFPLKQVLIFVADFISFFALRELAIEMQQ